MKVPRHESRRKESVMSSVPGKVLDALRRNDRETLRKLGSQGGRERARRVALLRAEQRRADSEEGGQDSPHDLSEYLRQPWVIEDAQKHFSESGHPLDD